MVDLTVLQGFGCWLFAVPLPFANVASLPSQPLPGPFTNGPYAARKGRCPPHPPHPWVPAFAGMTGCVRGDGAVRF